MRIACIFAVLALAPSLGMPRLASARGAPRSHHAKAPRAPRLSGRHGRGTLPPPKPRTAAEAYREGVEAYTAGNDAAAIEALKFVIANQPKPDARTWFYLGRSYGRQARYQEAR